MELRVLKYFLVVAREENITKAASLLHVTQPTLSRQLMQLMVVFMILQASSVCIQHSTNGFKCRMLIFYYKK